MCYEMKLKLQGLEIQQNFYSFDLHGVDSVEAGTVRGIGGDQRQLQRAHKEVVLRGDPSLYKASVSVQAMVKMMKDVQQGGFEEPQGLPPSRQNHAITLKEGASIPNLRPYRYPHYQKTEIEKLVAKVVLPVEHLRKVFQTLIRHQLPVNKKTCIFGATKFGACCFSCSRGKGRPRKSRGPTINIS
ncbi:hypothetical protein ACSQ67_006547 [Phaseolus vulgaris]